MTPFQGYLRSAARQPRVPLRFTLGYRMTPVPGYARRRELIMALQHSCIPHAAAGII